MMSALVKESEPPSFSNEGLEDPAFTALSRASARIGVDRQHFWDMLNWPSRKSITPSPRRINR